MAGRLAFCGGGPRSLATDLDSAIMATPFGHRAARGPRGELVRADADAGAGPDVSVRRAALLPPGGGNGSTAGGFDGRRQHFQSARRLALRLRRLKLANLD